MGIRQREYAGTEFVQFYGVVEDRNDPLHVGRVRVRCYGWHTNNKTELPTASLPWAQVMTPVNNAAMSGIGASATGLVEGTTVIGFFMDGRNAQRPMILGSIPGIGAESSGKNDSGFQDPDGIFPVEVGKPDTPMLAYDRWEEDEISIAKEESRAPKISTAKAPQLSKVSATPAKDATTWQEPEQRGGESLYPLNHVHRTEAGHVREIDNTPGCERIHEYHRSGTFYEIQADGSKITKVVKDNYEIVLGDNNVFIQGNCNITVNGDVRMLVMGDKIEEINGNLHQTIHGNRYVKMDGSDFLEARTNRNVNIGGNDFTAIAGDKTETVKGNSQDNVAGKYKSVVNGNDSKTIGGDCSTTVLGDSSYTAAGGIGIGSGGALTIKSDVTVEMNATVVNIHTDVDVTGDIDLTGTSTGAEHISDGIYGSTHTHTEQGDGQATSIPNS